MRIRVCGRDKDIELEHLMLMSKPTTNVAIYEKFGTLQVCSLFRCAEDEDNKSKINPKEFLSCRYEAHWNPSTLVICPECR